jgi:hypothetical protein
MAQALEDLDRRVTALESAQPAGSENVLMRIEQKVDAFHHVAAELIAESEQRTRAEIGRLDDRIGATERLFTDLLNERFDAVMAALDGLKTT